MGLNDYEILGAAALPVVRSIVNDANAITAGGEYMVCSRLCRGVCNLPAGEFEANGVDHNFGLWTATRPSSRKWGACGIRMGGALGNRNILCDGVSWWVSGNLADPYSDRESMTVPDWEKVFPGGSADEVVGRFACEWSSWAEGKV